MSFESALESNGVNGGDGTRRAVKGGIARASDVEN